MSLQQNKTLENPEEAKESRSRKSQKRAKKHKTANSTGQTPRSTSCILPRHLEKFVKRAGDITRTERSGSLPTMAHGPRDTFSPVKVSPDMTEDIWGSWALMVRTSTSSSLTHTKSDRVEIEYR
ncbi:hypothetical protein HYALB_00004667 [Hymenoscyphus albidus]|uniref:Uncharacterized protein n=1 Tax=Hymenoscyphus albidus TaxID=595503 RepID=A0A9N9LT59_9HELO|nr:hypothetical protein HYALB_00004667 [Hymenoscyphus albidus]